MDPFIPIRVREAIVRLHKDGGRTYEQIADLLQVGRATVSRVLRRHRESGDVTPLPRGGGNYSPIQGRVVELLRSIVTDMPDATVVELTNALMDRSGIETSRSSVQRALRRMGYTRKKSPSSRWSEMRPSTARVVAPSARSSRR